MGVCQQPLLLKASDIVSSGALGASNDIGFSDKSGFTRSKMLFFVARVRKKEIHAFQSAGLARVTFSELVVSRSIVVILVSEEEVIRIRR